MKPGFRIVALFAAAALAAAPALADGKGKGKGKHRNDHDDVDEVVRVVHYQRGGPPPWAPAHGYRRKQESGRAEYAAPVAYVAPYGIATGVCNRTLLGAAVGGAAGGLIASEVSHGKNRPAAIAGGALLGILLGGSVGNAMDQLDERCVGQVLEHAGSDQTVGWRNPDSGADYQVTPTRTWEEEGRYCREYTTTVRIGGKPQEAYGTACRQPDGSWERVG